MGNGMVTRATLTKNERIEATVQLPDPIGDPPSRVQVMLSQALATPTGETAVAAGVLTLTDFGQGTECVVTASPTVDSARFDPRQPIASVAWAFEQQWMNSLEPDPQVNGPAGRPTWTNPTPV